MPTSNFHIKLLDPSCWYKFTYWITNSADPDQLTSSETNWSGSTLFAKAGHIWIQLANDWKKITLSNSLMRCNECWWVYAYARHRHFLICPIYIKEMRTTFARRKSHNAIHVISPLKLMLWAFFWHQQQHTDILCTNKIFSWKKKMFVLLYFLLSYGLLMSRAGLFKASLA